MSSSDNDTDERSLDSVLNATVDVSDPGSAALLLNGEMTILGRMPWSSNGTYLVTVSGLTDPTAGSERIAETAQAIYKPESGERPLWDFPTGLWRREIAAHVVSMELGWNIIPPTVERNGPLGIGSVQFFVPSRFEEHYFTFKDEPSHRRTLERLCVFDIVTNNTDRKGGHILLSDTGNLWGIDHGLSFHEEFKLRTVMWDFAGDPLPADIADDLANWLDAGPSDRLRELLTSDELDAMRLRTLAVLAEAKFPHDPTGRRYPWPLV